MAVESKPGENGVNGANGAGKRRKRQSSLMQAAAALPSVETSLEEFIARANQTLVEVNWNAAVDQAREEDAQRKEADALRWKNAETQLRESEAREAALRRQLDGLQGKLAEAEARAAVAGTQVGSAAHDAAISELREKLESTEVRMRGAEARSQELAQALTAAKAEAAARPVTAVGAAFEPGGLDGDADERVRVAEAKAAKAIAAAKAASAGLTVSAADIAAIESGLVVPDLAPRSGFGAMGWTAVVVAFVIGLAAMFVVAKVVLKEEPAAVAQPAPVQQVQPQATQPPPAPPPAAPVKPTVTPIEDPAAQAAGAPAAADPAATQEPATEPAAHPTEPAKHPAAAPAAVHHAAPAAKKQPAKGGLADPFASPSKGGKAAPKGNEKKPDIVDPFK